MFLSLAKKNEFMEFESADLNRVPPLSLFRKSKRMFQYRWEDERSKGNGFFLS